jgi:hypothetical protein
MKCCRRSKKKLSYSRKAKKIDLMNYRNVSLVLGQALLILTVGLAPASVQAQNSFPLLSSGDYSGWSSDGTGITNPHLKLNAQTGYVRVVHTSASSTVSSVYNFQAGKNAYWGEPTDGGQYIFRGRDLIVGEGKLSIGTYSPRGKIDFDGPGDLYLVDDPDNGTGQSMFIPGHVYIGPHNGSNISYLQARRSNNSGTTSLRLRTTNGGSLTEAVHIEGNGNVGIGTVSPTARLELNLSAGPTGQNNGLRIWGGNSDTYFGNTQISFSYGGGGGAYSHSMKTRHNSATAKGNAFDFYVWQPGDAVNAPGSLHVMTLDGGKVGIGTTNPNEKLTVNGTIYGREVKVDLSVPGPDYVFEKNYNLTSLTELKSYIEANKHLPEVPSAKEMEQNGIKVGEMEMLLLKKIEELTLYVIALKQELDRHKEEKK